MKKEVYYKQNREAYYNRRPSPPVQILISGEYTTIKEAAARVGMDEKKFANKRVGLIRSLPANEAITWEHFNGKG